MKPKTIYLDYAAATPLDEEVRSAMHAAELVYANPSAHYASARLSKALLEQSRSTVATALGCTAAEIIFTSGGTESDNLALFGLANVAEKALGRLGHIITIGTEHPAVLKPVAQLEVRGWVVDFCPIQPSGMIDLLALEKLIIADTAIIAIGLASSEIGTIQPLAKISQLVQRIRTDRGRDAIPLFLHCDASAALESLPVHVHRLGVDTLSINAAKIYGPKGAGALFVRRGVTLPPQILGGGQEGGRRAGTENIVAVAGMAVAIKKTTLLRSLEARRQAKLRDVLLAELKKYYLQLEINGHTKHRLANNLNISLPGFDGDTLVTYLDATGIEVATGAACNANDQAPSSTILALGKTQAIAQSSLRISLGRATEAADIQYIVQSLKTITEKLDTISS